MFFRRFAALWAGAISMLVTASVALAAEFYVAPDGTPTGDGSAAKPWDLVTALKHPPQVKPGDTIWLRGGRYVGADRGTFASTLTGAPGKPIIVRQAPGERAIIGPTLNIPGGADVWFWGFEVENPDTKEYEPYQHARWPTVWLRGGERIKLINMVIHGGGQGIGAWVDARDLEIYGCIIFHNGWAGSNQGHGIYTQNCTGTKRLLENVIFNQLGRGFGIHAYGSKKAYVNNFLLEGNVAFGNRGNNILVGGGRRSEGIVVRHNYSYAGGGVRIGYAAHNDDAVVRDNLFATRCTLKNWDRLTFTGNTVFHADPLIQLDITKLEALPGYAWDRNTYLAPEAGAKRFTIAARQGGRFDFEAWRRRTGFDANSTFSTDPTKADRVIVRPNKYQKGRAHIIVFNFARRKTVAADLSKILKKGQAYVIRDVENYLGPPALRGVYTGEPIALPMDLTDVMQPVTRQRFTHSPVEFGVFVVEPAVATGAGG